MGAKVSGGGGMEGPHGLGAQGSSRPSGGVCKWIQLRWNGGRASLESLKTSGSPQTTGTIVGKNEIYNWENLVGPFLVHTSPPPPLLKRRPERGR